jgi:uncharacterized membrane protein
MKTVDFKKEWLPLILVLLPLIFLYYRWNIIPETIPLHFGIDGKADKWGSKGTLVSLIPLVSITLYLILLFIPVIDPKNKVENMGNKYYSVRLLIHLFLCSLLLFYIYSTYQQGLEFTDFIFPLLAVFMILLGNFVQALKPNYFLGIRTPWTLHDDTNWIKTHRFGGRWFMISGTILLIIWFIIGLAFKAYFLPFLLLVVLVPIIYSFAISKS